MPRAIAFAAYGGPENLQIVDVAARPPGSDEVVIAVRASGLNPVDLKLGSGYRGADPERLPLRIGFEASGVVTAVGADGLVGADGSPIAVGDEVIAFRIPGAHATELTVPAKDVLQKPTALSFEQAAGLLLVAATAEDAVQTVGLQAGETVLVHGVSGSVGRAIAQLARLRGARVVGTAAEHRHEELRALGVEPVVYGPGLHDRLQALGPFDAAVDTFGSDEAGETSVALVADPARIVTITGTPAILAAGGKAIGGGNPASDALRDAARPELVRLAAEGDLVIPIVATHPFDDFRAAFDVVAAGHAGGKVVLVY
ncbi:MAG TPA: NADP-dependent oxidoreductase [Microbacteriaceae bacterium]|nr:NADP-dependent oxidoreductase [Microbacteriaceae bacterium]